MEDKITDLLKTVTRPRHVKKIFDNFKNFEERAMVYIYLNQMKQVILNIHFLLRKFIIF